MKKQFQKHDYHSKLTPSRNWHILHVQFPRIQRIKALFLRQFREVH